MTSDSSKSFDLYYPEAAIFNYTFEPSVELQTISVTNSNIFKPLKKSKFRFARNDFLSMDINRNAMSYFNNPIKVNITQDLQAFNY